jgi:hypothetical protein
MIAGFVFFNPVWHLIELSPLELPDDAQTPRFK